jgi:hypothetical protein
VTAALKLSAAQERLLRDLASAPKRCGQYEAKPARRLRLFALADQRNVWGPHFITDAGRAWLAEKDAAK